MLVVILDSKTLGFVLDTIFDYIQSCQVIWKPKIHFRVIERTLFINICRMWPWSWPCDRELCRWNVGSSWEAYLNSNFFRACRSYWPDTKCEGRTDIPTHERTDRLTDKQADDEIALCLLWSILKKTGSFRITLKESTVGKLSSHNQALSIDHFLQKIDLRRP